MHHELKTWPPYFDAVARGDKPFEVRKDDRKFAVGDTLVLREYLPDVFDEQGMVVTGSYSGRTTEKVVIYKLAGGRMGLDPGYCILGLNAARIGETQKENPPGTLEQLEEKINKAGVSPQEDGRIALKLLLSIAVSLRAIAEEANTATANLRYDK